jgi:hypothetical protein
MSVNNLLKAIYAFLVVLWPTLTFAAASTFGATFEDVGFAAWVMVLVLSTVAGLTALLNRIGAQLQAAEETGHKIPSLRIFVAANLLGSWLTGLFFFLLCEHFDTPDFLEAAIVIGASYIGARLIERTTETIVERTLDRVFGASKYDSQSRYAEDRIGAHKEQPQGSPRDQ